MDIEILTEVEGMDYGWWARGHYREDEFIRECQKQHGEPPPRRFAPRDKVRLVYWRTVPGLDSTGSRISNFIEGRKGPGAYPVTVVEWERIPVT